MRRVDGVPRAERLAAAERWYRSAVVGGLPLRWQDAFVDQWKRGGDTGALRARLSSVRAALNASYDELRQRAAITVERCRRAMRDGMAALATMAAVEAARHGVSLALSPCDLLDDDDGPALWRWRVTDASWWLGRIRRAHAAAVESSARSLGLVGARADKYVSRESFERRQQQRRRNRKMVESHDIIADDGEVVALQRVCDGSPSNPAIRRGELMTRIRGLESCAESLAHAAIFVTITCPSRYHVKPAYAPGYKTPDVGSQNECGVRVAQKYLLAVWARIRAKLQRDGVAIYGMRIAEPHQDGTPHHHFLLFCERSRVSDVRRVVFNHALADSGSEPGAAAHRVAWVALTGAGAAAAYVAKYIAKSIDGHGVGLDLHGDDATVTSQRVEAWAATWGIRQFQQFGGVPIGLWREVRRVANDCGGLIGAARSCVHRVGDQRADYGEFCRLLGGPMVGRGALLSLAKERGRRPTRYGVRDVVRVVGVADLASGQTVPTRLRTWRVVRRSAARCDLGLVSLTVRPAAPVEVDANVNLGSTAVCGELFDYGEVRSWLLPPRKRPLAASLSRC